MISYLAKAWVWLGSSRPLTVAVLVTAATVIVVGAGLLYWLIHHDGPLQTRPFTDPRSRLSVQETALLDRYERYRHVVRDFLLDRTLNFYLDPVPAFRVTTPCVTEPPEPMAFAAVCISGPPCPSWEGYPPEVDDNGCCLHPLQVAMRSWGTCALGRSW